jgi:hypothetical protein
MYIKWHWGNILGVHLFLILLHDEDLWLSLLLIIVLKKLQVVDGFLPS